ncbi:MAG: cysteine hydrolase family protein [Verrucomicrobiales bacterium]
MNLSDQGISAPLPFTSERTRRRFLAESTLLAVGAAWLAGPRKVFADEYPDTRTMPHVPGRFRLRQRRSRWGREKSKPYEPEFEEVEWEASRTAIIVCDMWAEHPCRMAAQRVDMMAPRMNEVLTKARDHGAAIIHAPSSGVHHYEGTPWRKRMQEARPAKPPVPIQGRWECQLDRETELPVEARQRVEGAASGCDDPQPAPMPDADRHQHPAIKIIGYDGISHSGGEIYNFLAQEGIRNVVLMGVHTNMCVLGRPFGIRQQVLLGYNVALARDLTDALYDPRDPPHVSHARGTELIIQHIEKYWCPSILGRDLTEVVPGSNHAGQGT